MKMEINAKHIGEESFVEERVTKMDLRIQDKICNVELDGGVTFEAENNEYKSISIVISKWSNLEVHNYPHEKEKTIIDTTEYSNFFLRDICKFNLTKFKLCICGFSIKHLGWVEWQFTNPTIKITGELDND